MRSAFVRLFLTQILNIVTPSWPRALRRCMVFSVLVSTLFFSLNAGADLHAATTSPSAASSASSGPSNARAPQKVGPPVSASATATPVSASATVAASSTPAPRKLGPPVHAPSPTPNPPPPVNGAHYISPTGTDAHDGLTPQTAWQTFANIAGLPSGAVVLAQAGGVWNTSIKVPTTNMTFGVYGTGAKPKIVAPSGQYAFDNNWKSSTLLDGWEFTSVNRTGGSNGIVLMVGDNYHVRNTIVHSSDIGLLLAQGQHGLLENSEFYDSNTSGGQSAVNILGHVDNTTPSDTELSTIQGNSFHDIGYRSLELDGTELLAQTNSFTRWTLQHDGTDTSAPSGLYVSENFPGPVTVRNNTFNGTGVEGPAMRVDTGPANVLVTGNVATNAYYCFWSEKTNGSIFTSNTCQNMTQSGVRWGNVAPEGPASVGGEVSSNTFVGATPKEGWVVIYSNGSSADVSGNITKLLG